MNDDAYEEFKNTCGEHLTSLQEEFIKLYDINSYEHWFYDHDIGAFHFKSDDGRNLYFKYVDVGSFSTKTNSWMWSWDNDSTPKHVTKGIEKVKKFGEENNFTDLTQGYLDNSDEYTGWALTSISAKLLSAIGAYRVPSGHLFSFFIFTNELTEEEYDALKNKYIDCGTHGRSRVAFVCQHLLKGSNRGFHEAVESNPSIEPEEDYWALCDDCEKFSQQHGEFNDAVKEAANMKVVCDQCYFEAKQRNRRA